MQSGDDNAPSCEGMTIFLQFHCIQCGTNVYSIEAHSHGFFSQCVRHPGMERVVMRHHGRGSKGEVVHMTVFLLIEAGYRISARFVARRVWIDVLQAHIRHFLLKRRRALESRRLAFAMGSHPRLGAGNPVFTYLSNDATGLVLQAVQ